MVPVAQYDVREAEAELLRAGFEPALIGYLDAAAVVAGARLPKRRKACCGPLGVLSAMVAQRIHGFTQAETLQLLGLRTGEEPYARSGALSKGLRKSLDGLLERGVAQTAERAERLALVPPAPDPARPALRVRLLDGSGVHLLDTPANQAAYPQSSRQAPGAGWPALRFVALTDAASGAILEVSCGNLHDHDAKLGRPLWDRLGAGDLVVLDCGFSSYGFLWGMQKRGAQTVVRQHQRRQNSQPPPAAVGEVTDFTETWTRPAEWPEWWDADQPATLSVRVVAKRLSAKEVLVVNTMLPRETYSADEVLELYRGRQRVETGFAELKTTLDTALLAVGDPTAAQACLQAALLTHNLVCCVVSEAAAEVGQSRWRYSYQTAVSLLRMPSRAGVHGTPEEEAKRVRRELTRYAHPARDPNRREPRARKASHRPQKPLKGHRKDELARLGR